MKFFFAFNPVDYAITFYYSFKGNLLNEYDGKIYFIEECSGYMNMDLGYVRAFSCEQKDKTIKNVKLVSVTYKKMKY